MIPSGGEGCPGCARVAAALAGRDPALVAELPASVLVLGDHQAFPGYAVLWSRVHVVEAHHLDPGAYDAFMRDYRAAAWAVERATGCLKLNTAVLGNQVRHCHIHLFPRPADDPSPLEHPWVHSARFGEPGDAALRRRWIRALKEALP